MSRGLRRASALACITTLASSAGCGARADGPDIEYGGPIESTDTPRGRSRYLVVCAPCHETHTALNAPSLAGLGWTAARIRRQVREGTALMPPIRMHRLSDDDLESLLAYLVDVGTAIDPDAPAP